MTTLIRQKTEAIVTNRITHFMMAAFIFAAALLYVYFANVAVRTLTALENTKEEMQTLSVEVSDMESKRLTLQNSVNSKLAAQLGFVEVDHPTFIMKSSSKTALSFKTN